VHSQRWWLGASPSFIQVGARCFRDEHGSAQPSWTMIPLLYTLALERVGFSFRFYAFFVGAISLFTNLRVLFKGLLLFSCRAHVLQADNARHSEVTNKGAMWAISLW